MTKRREKTDPGQRDGLLLPDSPIPHQILPSLQLSSMWLLLFSTGAGDHCRHSRRVSLPPSLLLLLLLPTASSTPPS